MIEVLINILQIIILMPAFVISFRNAFRYRSREWSVTAFFFAVFLMADIYWMLVNLFYHRNAIFYISEIGWYSGFLFLDILLMMLTTEEEAIHRYNKYKSLWIFPVCTFFMMVFFVWKAGDLIGNLVTFFFMTALILRSGRGLIYLSRPESAEAGDKGERKTLYTLVMIYCISEYVIWTLSCFWMGNTLLNPYYWLDIFNTVLLLMMVPAIRKAVNR